MHPARAPLAARLPIRRSVAVGLLALSASASAQVSDDHAARMAAGLELFREHVRPLLEERCLRCHGGQRTRSELDLASREALLVGGASGVVVSPGHPQRSRLLALVRHTEEPHMPKGEQPLSSSELEHLESWIELGAPYDRPLAGEHSAAGAGAQQVTEEDRRWWSFLPLEPVAPPPVEARSWCRNPIDSFILAQLEQRGLPPRASAERGRLIRRLHFDLIGLPPTQSQIQAFVEDPSDDAYTRLVERLLASPHFGERWARHWLDVVRFAESHGFEQDYDRPHAFHYRDFVIRALNSDLPYDQFVRWQLAGDEIESESPEPLIATGFLAAGAFPTQLTEKEFERARYDELDDMVGTMGTAMLGLTIGCARCHDHKFDPIPASDYYRILSSFTTTIRSNVEVELDAAQTAAEHERWQREHRPLAEALASFEREVLPGRLERWLAAQPRSEVRPTWTPLELTQLDSRGGATFQALGDGSHLATGESPANDHWLLRARAGAEGITAFRLEALSHPSLVRGGPGRASNGNFALSSFRIFALDEGGPRRPVEIREARSTFDQRSLPVRATIDDDPTSSWAVDPQFGRDHAALFVLEQPLAGPDELEFELEFNNNVHHSIGRPRLSYTTLAEPSLTSASKLGPWYAAGPFTAESGRVAFDTPFAPEAGVDLSLEQGGERVWRERAELADDTAHTLAGERAATYLYRTIRAPSPRRFSFAVGSDDAVKVWLNGRLVHEHWVLRGVQVGQDAVSVELREGSNDLLMKVVNQAGGYGFSFGSVTETSLGGLPIEIEALLGAPEQLTSAQRARLSEWFRGTDAEWRALEERVSAHLAHEPRPKLVKVMVASENVTPIPHHADGRGFPHFYAETHFLERGDPNRKGDVATQGFLQALMPAAEAHTRWQVPAPEGATTSFRRTSLANWVTDTDGGAGALLARVIVNRLWQHLLGQGLVSTPNDFGLQGAQPSHPLLLDWLAGRLIEEDWRLKPILRLILESSTYRQRPGSEATAEALDPDNRWLSGRDLRRLDAEIIRDAMLSVSGLLDTTMFGPGTLDEQMKRRSLYFFQKRSKLVESLQLFDAPQLLTSIGARPSTTIAPQALLLLNSPIARTAARALADRVASPSADSSAGAVEQAWWLALGRAPSDLERQSSARFIERQLESYARTKPSDARQLALTDYCQAIMSLNEFIYVD